MSNLQHDAISTVETFEWTNVSMNPSPGVSIAASAPIKLSVSICTAVAAQ